MNDNKEVADTSVQSTDGDASTIKAITDLKNRVDSLSLQLKKTQGERDDLLNKFINDQPIEEEKPEEKPAEVKPAKTELELAKEFGKLVAEKPNNLEYCKKMIEMDNYYLEHKGESIFDPYGREVQITANERETSKRVHDAIQSCIDQANGDPKAFDEALARVCPGRFPDKTGRK